MLINKLNKLQSIDHTLGTNQCRNPGPLQRSNISVLVNKYRYLVYKHEYNANATFIYIEVTSFTEVQPNLLNYIITEITKIIQL